MALDVVAVETFTQGRLDRDDDETQRQLDAALAYARNYCGWHVTPGQTEQSLTVDGPGATVLTLPTLALSALTAVTEDGVELDVDTIDWSARGMLVKTSGLPWTARFRGITVTITHGFATAPDFDAAILAAIDRGGFASGDTADLKVIGPFQYETSGLAAGAIFSDAEMAVLDRYRLETAP